MPKQEREIGIDQASPFLQAAYNHPAIYQGKDNSPVLTVDREGMQELSARVLCPGVADGSDGYYRIILRYRHNNHPDPKEFEHADYFAAEIAIPHPEIPGLDRFLREASDGWDEFLESARRRDRNLPEPGVHRLSKGNVDSGTVYFSGWDESGFILQTEDLWPKPYDARKSGVSFAEYGTRTVEVLRQLARTVPAYLADIQKSGLIRKWQTEREKRRRSKPAAWTLEVLKKLGVQAEGEWLPATDSPEPDTYIAQGGLGGKGGWYVIVRGIHFETEIDSGVFGIDDLDVVFLFPKTIQDPAGDQKKAEALIRHYLKYLEENTNWRDLLQIQNNPGVNISGLIPTVIRAPDNRFYAGLVASDLYYSYKDRAGQKKQPQILRALFTKVREHEELLSRFLDSLE